MEILDAELPILTKVSRSLRLKTLFFDYLSMCTILPLCFIPLFGIMWLIERYTSYGCFMFYLATYIAVLLQKDMLNGMSIGKRMAGLQVVDIHMNKKANRLKCVLRNILWLIFPLEIIFLLLKPERRLGDLIAGTRVVVCPVVPFLETKKEFKESDKMELFKSFVFAFLAAFLLIYLITFFIPIEKTHISQL